MVDTIQHAYGWTDEYVLNLPLSRVVQIKEAIEQREDFARYYSNRITEWHAYAINTILANSADSKEAREELMKIVSKISLTNPNSGGDTKKRQIKKSPSTFKLKDGTVLPISEIENYSYAEVDRSEKDAELKAAARKANSGKNISGIMNGKF